MKSADYVAKYMERIVESQVNLWNGIMVFSGIVVTFLAGETERSLLLVFLMILYFLMGATSIYLIFQVRGVYSHLHNRLLEPDNISDEKKEHYAQKVIRKYESTAIIEKILKWICFITIVLTFIYLIQSNAAILESALKTVRLGYK